MLVLISLLGIFVFLGVGALFSKNRKEIPWRIVARLVVINIILAAFFNVSPIGRNLVRIAAEGFTAFVNVAYVGIGYALPNWVYVEQMNFITAALLPLLMIVPFFDILTYFGIFPFIIRSIGKIIAVLCQTPKFESFYVIEMMFLGHTEALAVSKIQLQKMALDRVLAIAFMSMSCISASLIGAYCSMMPPEYILTAVPLNVINAIIISKIIMPTKINSEDDVIFGLDERKERPPFFAYLTDSFLSAGRLIFIITCAFIAFVSLAALVNAILAFFHPALSLENVLGVFMFPLAFLLGLPADEAFILAEYMGKKLITNEFVVMLKAKNLIQSYSPHLKATLTLFVTSFANLSSVGIIIGALKGILTEDKMAVVSKHAGRMMLSGLLVSLLTAAIGGIFIW